MKNKKFIFFTILMIFATTFSANTESLTYISGIDSIKDFPPIFNADVQVLANRRYESISSPTINNDGVDTAGEGRTFDVGNLWLNTTSGQYYICIDNSTGASVWKLITLSASDIKTLYESNPDTNAFTDALLTKLNNIAENADNVADSATNGNILINGVETTVYDDSNVVKLTGNQNISGIKTFNDNISVDTISEKTLNNGVIIDGVKIKDGGGYFTGGIYSEITKYNIGIYNVGGTGSLSHNGIYRNGAWEFPAGIDNLTSAYNQVNGVHNFYSNKTAGVDDFGIPLLSIKNNDAIFNVSVGIGRTPTSNEVLGILSANASSGAINIISTLNSGVEYMGFRSNNGQYYANMALDMDNNAQIFNNYFSGNPGKYSFMFATVEKFAITSDGIVSMPNQANISMVATNSLSLTANTTNINFTTDEIDPQAEFNGTTYTPDTSGKVFISIQAQGSTGKINCYENGTLYRNIIIAEGALSGSRLIPVTAGNSYTFRSSTTVTITNRSITILKSN